MTVSARREREIQRVRRDILSAAARAFALKGYGETTMQEIAREAGYTAPALYTYFRSKEEILEAFGQFLEEQILGTFDQPMPGGLTLRQRLELLLQRQAEYARENRELFEAFFTALPSARGVSLYIARLAQWLREGGVERIGGLASDELATFLTGILYASLIRWMRDRSGWFSMERISHILDLFFHGVGERDRTR